MKSFLIILALCTADGTQCVPAPEEAEATVFEYERLADCVRADHWFTDRYAVEAYCASDEVSPADYLKG